MCFVYADFRQLARDQSAAAAQTVEVLRALDTRLQRLELVLSPSTTPQL